jgi:hypothetical protein
MHLQARLNAPLAFWSPSRRGLIFGVNSKILDGLVEVFWDPGGRNGTS